jgi:adenylate kinase family enzyme
MSLVCLLGRHGVGKSALGRQLGQHGFAHWSMGLLRRLASRRTFPTDIPPSLLLALGREPAGQGPSAQTAALLMELANARRNVVIDGFPTSSEHLDLLPRDAVLLYIWTPERVRLERLERRGLESRRQWAPQSRRSAREAQLASILWAARKCHCVLRIANLGPVDEIAMAALGLIDEWRDRTGR